MTPIPCPGCGASTGQDHGTGCAVEAYIAATPPGPDLGAAVDQTIAELTDIAPVMGRYFRALLDGGCDETLARTLVQDWHYARIISPTPVAEEDPT